MDFGELVPSFLMDEFQTVMNLLAHSNKEFVTPCY